VTGPADHPPDLARADFEATLAFHGHLCLDIAMGYRVATAALKALEGIVDDPKALVATVGNDTCAVDAVQAVTGCTFGKRNLVPNLTGKPAYTWQHAASGEGVRVYVHYWEGFDPDGGFRQRMRDFKDGRLPPDEAAAFEAEHQGLIDHILAAPQDELFTLRRVQAPPPPRSGGFQSHPCAGCGEHVKAAMLVDGRCAECRSGMTYAG
jgi:formylmethanofuran dehydrogenase subunit E